GAGVGRDPAVRVEDLLALRPRRERGEIQLAGERLHAPLAGANPLASEVDPLPAELLAPGPSPDAIARLEDQHVRALARELARSGEAGEAGADDDDVCGSFHVSAP